MAAWPSGTAPIGEAPPRRRAALRALCSAVLLPALIGIGAPAAATGILRIGNGTEPETLDPHRGQGVSTGNIERDLYEGLTTVGAGGVVAPGAAERWEADADGLGYTFHLRPQARWSNGDPVSAADFVAGLRRSADPATGSRYTQILSPILNAAEVSAGRLPPQRLGVDAPDALTVHVRLNNPAPYLPGLMAHPSTFPLHQPSLQRYGADFARPGRLVGNGAYRLREWVVQSRVTLERNPYYWGDTAAAPDQVIYYPTEDLASELQRYRSGELDITSTVPMSQARWVRQLFGAELHLAPYLGSFWYGYNLSRPPFAGQAGLRRALSMVIDRDVIAGKLLQDAALPAYAVVPPGTWNHEVQSPEWAAWPMQRRIDEARRLYAAAGYSDSHPLQLELRYNTQDDLRRLATVVAAMWKQHLGVQTSLVNEEWKVFVQNRRRRAVTQVFRSGWIADYDEAGGFLDLLRSFDGQNDEAYAEPAYDALLAQAARQSDPAVRRDLQQQAERKLLDDQPLLPLFYYQSKHLLKPWVAGWQDNPLDIHYSKDLRLQAH